MCRPSQYLPSYVTWLLMLAFILLQETTFAQDTSATLDGWQWSWLCKGGKCVKSDRPRAFSASLVGTTHDICRLTCGKYGALWPQPTGQTTLGHQLIAFHPSRVKVEILDESENRAVRDYMQRVSKLWQGQLYAECGPDCTIVPETQVTVYITTSASDLTLDWTTDESYSLDVITKENQVVVKILSQSVFGARHGLETLAQLVTGYTANEAESKQRDKHRVLVMVAQVQILDAPVYPHRGLLIDTARNFLPMSAIMRTIDGMAHVKLNVLHWHATDTQSFPLSTKRVPQLAIYGAYSAEKTYNTHEIAELIEYARLRGVRVIIEIDTPAHVGNGWQWGEAAGLGKLAVCVNQQPWRSYCIQPPCGQLNPANPNIYALLRDLYQDLIELLPPGETFHMGGDEVFFACWNNSQEVVSYMADRGLGRAQNDFVQLWSDFQATNLKVFDEVNPKKVPVILWSSQLTDPAAIEKYLDKSRYIIETWVEASMPLPKQLLEKGYKLIMATKDTWYLDHGFRGQTTFHNWQVAYDNVIPRNESVLGGETAIWAELVDENSLDTKVWPRAGAVGERLWSNPSSSSYSAEPRMQQLRNRLVRRGLRADSISPEYCTQNEFACV